jgi:hypothetical protein
MPASVKSVAPREGHTFYGGGYFVRLGSLRGLRAAVLILEPQLRQGITALCDGGDINTGGSSDKILKGFKGDSLWVW